MAVGIAPPVEESPLRRNRTEKSQTATYGGIIDGPTSLPIVRYAMPAKKWPRCWS